MITDVVREISPVAKLRRAVAAEAKTTRSSARTLR